MLRIELLLKSQRPLTLYLLGPHRSFVQPHTLSASASAVYQVRMIVRTVSKPEIGYLNEVTTRQRKV
jgi:hypothetical protein